MRQHREGPVYVPLLTNGLINKRMIGVLFNQTYYKTDNKTVYKLTIHMTCDQS